MSFIVATLDGNVYYSSFFTVRLILCSTSIGACSS